MREEESMIQQLKEWLRDGGFAKVRKELEPLRSADIADCMLEMEPKEVLLVFSILPKELSAEVFSHFSANEKKHLVEAFTDEETLDLLLHMQMDDRVDLLEELPANLVNRLLSLTEPSLRQEINKYLGYDEESAGGVMTSEFVAIRKDLTIAEALDAFRTSRYARVSSNELFVTDECWTLEGVVSLKTLLLSPAEAKVAEVMDGHYVSTTTSADQEAVAKLFMKYDLRAMPVTDNDQRLVGVITVDDVMDVVVQEQTEDMQKMAAMTPSELPYLEQNIWSLSKHRIGWLMILMVTATITGGIISSYEDVLSQTVALAIFIPMLMDTGGNAGAQSSTLLIRSIALGQVEFKDFFKVLWKELRVGLLCGLVLALLNTIRILMISDAPLAVAIVVNISIVATVVFSKALGGILPILSDRVGLDPAMMTGPLITTVVDTCALLIYFALASLLL